MLEVDLRVSVADLRGVRDAHLLEVQILSISCSFWGKWQNRMLAPPGELAPRLGEILDPLLSFVKERFVCMREGRATCGPKIPPLELQQNFLR